MPRKKTTNKQNLHLPKDVLPAEAWEAEYYYSMIRKLGSQQEADRRWADPRLRQMIEWAQANPRNRT